MWFKNVYSTSTKEGQILLDPVLHISQKQERRNINKRVFRAFNYWTKCPKDKQKILADILDTLYDACIVSDDIQDNGVLRRGIPAAHLVYGTPLSTNSCIYTAFVLFEELLKLTNDKDTITDYFIQLGIEFFTGQGIEIHSTNTCICLSDEDYKQLVHCKSASTITFALRLLQFFGHNTTFKEYDLNTSTFLEKFAYFTEIYNDYINLRSKKYSDVRVYCDDLTEGKLTFPMIHAIRSQPHDDSVINLIKKRPADLETKKYFVSLLESFGSFEYTRKALENFKMEYLKALHDISDDRNPYIEKVLIEVYGQLDTEIYFDGCD